MMIFKISIFYYFSYTSSQLREHRELSQTRIFEDHIVDAKQTAQQSTVKIVSWNIGALGLIDNIVDTPLYETRKSNLKFMLETMNPDIIFFQEVFAEDALHHLLSINICTNNHYFGLDLGNNSPLGKDGLLICSPTYNLTNCGQRQFADVFGLDEWAAKGFSYCTVSHNIHIINTHLQADQDDWDHHESEAIVRGKQITELIDYVSTKNSDNSNIKFIVGGDFNIDCCNILDTSPFTYENLKGNFNSQSLKDAEVFNDSSVDQCSDDNKTYISWNPTPSSGSHLDYFFISNTANENSYVVYPLQNDGIDLNPLPSDHRPISITINVS